MRKWYIYIYISISVYIYIYIYIKFSKIVTDSDTSLRTQVTIFSRRQKSSKETKTRNVIIFQISLFLQYSIPPLYIEFTSLYNKTSNSFQFLCNKHAKNISSVSNNHYNKDRRNSIPIQLHRIYSKKAPRRYVYPMKQKCQLND